MLKSKKHNTQEEWVAALDEATAEAKTQSGKRRAEHLLDVALSRIPIGNVAYGWSGGKDSIALEVICEAAGIGSGIMVTKGRRWEWPSFNDFVDRCKPPQVEIVDIGITPKWLNENAGMVWPDEYRFVSTWMKLRNRYLFGRAVERGIDTLLLGHRNQDGNWCNGGRYEMGSFERVFPIYDFSHEDVFLLIAYGGKTLPDTYFYEDGFKAGTLAWVAEHGRDGARKVWRNSRMTLYENCEVNKVRDFIEEKGRAHDTRGHYDSDFRGAPRKEKRSKTPIQAS